MVRLEALDHDHPPDFALVAAAQEITATCIPDLVPATLQTGTAANDGGRVFQYAVLEFVEGVTLEQAWDHMSPGNRASVVAAVVEAVSKLQAARLGDASIQIILRRALGERGEGVLDKALMGGPLAGFLDDEPSLLAAIEDKWKLQASFHTTQPVSEPEEGLVVTSAFQDLGSVTVTKADMDKWPEEAVFCHNDLTPRNLMLRPREHDNGHGGPSTTTYELAAVIDWELAGFYPPSYQLALQDTYLGTGNLRPDFYLLLKQGLMHMTPPSPSQLSLVRAAELIFESRQKRLLKGGNIPAQIRARFMEMLRLSRAEDPYLGWRPEPGGDELPEFSREDGQKLEDEVVAEVVARRQAKAAKS